VGGGTAVVASMNSGTVGSRNHVDISGTHMTCT